MTNNSDKTRPYWHVDAKWITGILMILLLNITLYLFLLFQVTAPEQGIKVLATTMASAFSYEGGGLDQAGDVEIMKQKIAESPDGSHQPVPGIDISVRMDDIEGKSPREARLWFFRQFAEPLYYQGQQGLLDKMTDPNMKEEVSGGIGPLAIISESSHAKIKNVFIISSLVSVFFLGLLILFSYRFGRLGSPGFVIFLTAVPNLLLLAGAQKWLSNPSVNQDAEGLQSTIARYSQLAGDVLPEIIQMTLTYCVILTILGIILMAIAIIGMVFFRGKKKEIPPEPAG